MNPVIRALALFLFNGVHVVELTCQVFQAEHVADESAIFFNLAFMVLDGGGLRILFNLSTSVPFAVEVQVSSALPELRSLVLQDLLVEHLAGLLDAFAITLVIPRVSLRLVPLGLVAVDRNREPCNLLHVRGHRRFKAPFAGSGLTLQYSIHFHGTVLINFNASKLISLTRKLISPRRKLISLEAN